MFETDFLVIPEVKQQATLNTWISDLLQLNHLFSLLREMVLTIKVRPDAAGSSVLFIGSPSVLSVPGFSGKNLNRNIFIHFFF